MQNRTDLALELKEEKNIGSAQSGIIVKTRIDTTNHIKETKIIIKNKKGEDSLGKPKGTYITIVCCVISFLWFPTPEPGAIPVSLI